MIDGWHYQEYMINRHNATHAFYVAAAFGGAKKVEDLCGKWINGRVMTITEATKYYENKHNKKKKVGHNG